MSRVLARRGLPRGRVSRAFHVGDLNDLDTKTKENIYIDLDAQGLIIATGSDGGRLQPASLIKASIAGDVQNRNLELYSEGDSLRVRLLKDVAPDDPLELWFSEEILARLDMPFLTPRNIKGRKNYICHECGVQFEQPNPLKLHMFLSCQEFTSNKFWKKILAKMKEENSPLNLSLDNLPQSANNERPKSQENVEKTYNSKINSRCNSEPPSSAFKPYKMASDYWYAHFNNNTQMFPRLPSELSIHPAYTLQRDLLQHQAYRNWQVQNVNSISKSLERVSVANPAEIEALATNWGKSKEGHLCLYCGKVYSRKYGLKIHIRTHTGYKPLQCKYCLRPFGDPSNLNKHVRLHAQTETPYSCHLCGKMLVRKRDLDRHLRSRHGDDDRMTRISTDSPSP